jgi:diguanylate cyclase (GGDEF)-like protein
MGAGMDLGRDRLGARRWGWTDWVATPRARRVAVFGLTVVLVALSAAAVASSRRQGVLADRAADAARATDRYQEARYLAAVQHADYEEALVGDPASEDARLAHRQAAAEFVAVLESLRTTDGDDAASLDRIVIDQGRYLALTDRFFLLTAAGRRDDAEALHQAQIEPVESRIMSQINALEAKNRADSVAAQGDLRRHTRALQVGTPVALAVGLLLLIVFAMMTRFYRRTAETQASYDALTGLPNRTHFQQRCEQALQEARRTGGQPVVLLLDLNNFKQVNDTLGHHMGDQLLTRVAARLAETFRDRDTVSRLGGDEFAVLLRNGGPVGGEQVAERITAQLHQPFILDGVTLDVEASIGIAAASPGDDVLTMVRHADTAMYVAKKFHVGHAHYSAEHDHNTVTRLNLLSDLRRALDADEFVLHYQPKIAMDTGEVTGVEALTRWQHPTRGLLFPDEFITALDATNLAYPFTLHVMEKALAHTRSWYDRGRRLPVAVNISTRCLLDQRLPEAIAALLHASTVPPDALCLEITEGTIMADPDRALDVLTRIRALGVRTSIDDFGTGYSSMAYLKLLPVDELKIDRSFVRDMATDPKNRMLVQSAIDLGHNLGLAVVAEGIEDQATLTALHRLGCDIAQGYLFARPLPADALATWIQTHAETQARGAATQHRSGAGTGEHNLNRGGAPTS